MGTFQRIGRRRAIALGLASGLTFDARNRAVMAAERSQMRAVVSLGGKTFDYAAQAGEDLGDFKSEIGGFSQTCVRVIRNDCPLTVYFRPDRESDRREVVFELGKIWESQPAHLGDYSVTIFIGAEQVAKIDVPKHYWFSRWRWQSDPRPVVGKVDDLINRSLLPPYKIGGNVLVASQNSSIGGQAGSEGGKVAKGLPGGGGQINLPATATTTAKGAALGIGAGNRPAGAAAPADPVYAVMGMAGVAEKMGTTGERADIGMVTEYQARFIITGAADALAIARDQAEAAGTVPWHMRDERTGAPVDLDAYPTMSWYGSRADNPHVATLPCDIEVESSHQPALAYLPYLLTGDPYHLEDLQFAANWNRGGLPPDYRFSIPQTRGYAWNTRTRAQCAKITPAVTPRWLLPRAYWEKDLEQHRQWLTQTFINNPEPLRSVFRSVEDLNNSRDEGATTPLASWIAPWMDEFLASTFGWVVMMGFESWKPIFLWKIGSTIQRTSKTSGWHRGHSSPYRLLVRSGPNASFFKTWAEAWALASRNFNWENDDPETIKDDDLTYYTYTRGALVFAARLGVPDADTQLAWINGQLQKRNAKIAFKWQVA